MSSPQIPSLGLGTYENTDPDTCRESVRTALDTGYRHVDTAEGYDNETAVGAGIAAADVDREDVFLATKVSPENLAYEDVLDHVAASRDRLGVETIDLLYVHWPLDAYDPERTLAAFDDLYDEGVVRAIGLSNFLPEQLDEALEHLSAPLAAHQVECHPLLHQDELLAHARAHDYRLVAYSPLAKGDVTEIPGLVEIAEAHDATPAQIALAWLLARDAVVIPKASSEAHIRENLGALDLTLSAAEIERIDAIDRTERKVDFEGAPWR